MKKINKLFELFIFNKCCWISSIFCHIFIFLNADMLKNCLARGVIIKFFLQFSFTIPPKMGCCVLRDHSSLIYGKFTKKNCAWKLIFAHNDQLGFYFLISVPADKRYRNLHYLDGFVVNHFSFMNENARFLLHFYTLKRFPI